MESEKEKAFVALENALKHLLQQYAVAKDALARSEAENEKLRQTVAAQNEELNHFKYQIKISKIVDAPVVGQHGKEALKALIDKHIQALDECIAYFEKTV